jgi:dihydrofolate synthase/folylpolyglutamate synthase
LRATDLQIAEQAWAEGVQSAQISGRLQHWQTNPDVILDVAHNRQSVAQLAEWLAGKPKPTLAVFSALNDKDIVAMIDDLRPYIGHWYVAPLREPAERVTSYSALADIFGKNLPAQEFTLFTDIPAAYRQACLDCTADGRVLVFGSFHTLESVMHAAHA